MRTEFQRDSENRLSPGYVGRGGERPQNFGSARSDYGRYAYGGRLNDQGFEDRGWFDRAADEVSSWFGDTDAERRRRMDENRWYLQQRDRRRQQYADDRPGRRFTGDGPAYRSGDRPASWQRHWTQLHSSDLMTRGVATVHPDDPVEHAARLMGDCDCGAIPVVDRGGRMVGMITDRDIAIRLVGNGANSRYAKVGDCMTDEAFACHVDDSLDTCMRTMSRHKIRRLPVVDDSDRVVGIISQADIAQHASENAGTGERRAMSDVVCAISEPTRSSYV